MENNHEGHFYKGLFFGLLLGVGVVVFSQTEKGKKFIKQAKTSVDETLSKPIFDDFYEDEEIGIEKEPAKRRPKSLKKFFKKK